MTKTFKFTVEFALDEGTIANGGFLNRDDVFEMLYTHFGYTDAYLLDARVTKFPDLGKVAKTMGYESAERMHADQPSTIPDRTWVNAE